VKTKTLKKNRVNVVTLGCSKNLVDSEVLMAQLRANNYEVKHEEGDAPIVVINTCGFIDNAKQESIDTILRYVDAKQKGEIEKVYVTGCLSQRYRPELEREIPQVDGYFGTRDLPRLLKTLKADYKHELVGERLLTTPNHYAYVKISEGCDRKCSFCAIPLMRGEHISVPMDKLVEQAKGLVKQGVKEIMLIAQDLTYYGLDMYGKRNVAELIHKLAEVEGMDWIRLHYAFPSGFPMDIIDAIKEHPNVCNYLDMPLQHVSDNVLKAMRRGITKEKSTKLVETIREKVPGIAMRTTFLVGYPGETDNDFQQLVDWVQEMKFDRLGVFTYSHEEDTHAHKAVDDVPSEIKAMRAKILMDTQRDVSYKLNKKKIGKTLKVLFDRKEGEYFIGRTEHDSPEVDNEVHVKAEGDTYVRIGDFTDIKITSAEEYDLFGIPVK